MGFQEDLDWLASTDYKLPTTTPTLQEIKQDRLNQRTTAKQERLGLYSRSMFNDADTTGFAPSTQQQVRLSSDTLPPNQWVDAPESPWTAENVGVYNPSLGYKVKRKLTPEELSAYNASKVALDNFAMGTTPVSNEAWQDFRDNPLTPEHQAQYDEAMRGVEYDNLAAFGTPGITDNSGKRQLGDFVNETYNPNETLSDRLLQTGNAGVVTTGLKTDKYSNLAFSEEEIDAMFGGSLEDGRSITKQAGSFVQAFGQGAVKTGILDTIDFVGEFTGIGDFGTEDEKEAIGKKWTGYDSKYSDEHLEANKKILQKNLHEINPKDIGKFDEFIEDVSGKDGVLNNMNKIVSNMSGKDFGDFMSNAFANTDTTGYSLGMLVGMTAGTKGTGLAKVGVKGGTTAKEAIAAVKATDTLTRAEKAVTTTVILNEAYKNANLLQKTVNQIGKNSGLLVVNAGQVNDQLDEFETNMGRPATAEEKVVKYFSNLGGLMIDRAIDVRAVKGVIGKDIIKEISNLIAYSPKSASMAIIAKLVKSTAAIGLAGATEVPTEGIQTAIEELNKVDYSTEKGKKIFQSKVTDILNAAGSGFTGAAHMSTPSQVVGLVNTGLDSTGAKEKLNEKISGLKEDVAASVTPEKEEELTLAEEIRSLDSAEAEVKLQEHVSEIKAEADSTGKKFTEVLNSKSKKYREEFNEAYNYQKLRTADEAVESGDVSKVTLGATSSEEAAIKAAYAKAKTDKLAEEFATNIKNSHPEDVDIDRIITEAKETRAVATELGKLSSISTTREGVVTKGLTEDKKGFLEYFHAALRSPAGSKAREANEGKLASFTNSQQSKVDKLTTGREAATSQLADKIKGIAGSTLSTDTVAKAMLYATKGKSKQGNEWGMTSDPTNGPRTYEAEYNEVIAAGVTPEKLRLDTVNGYTIDNYASVAFNKKDVGYDRATGSYTISEASSLLDYITETDIGTDRLAPRMKSGSSVGELIDGISAEVGTMNKAADLIRGNTKRKTKETPPEQQEGTQKAQTTEEDVTTQEEVKEAPEEDMVAEGTPVEKQPMKKDGTMLDTEELYDVPSTDEYNTGTREALLQLFRTNKYIKRTLDINKIDLKDC